MKTEQQGQFHCVIKQKKIKHVNTEKTVYFYVVFSKNQGVITSNELFDYKQEAYFAAIGHINLLKKGES